MKRQRSGQEGRKFWEKWKRKTGWHELLSNEKKIVNFTSTIPLEKLKRSFKIKSFVDTYRNKKQD